MNDANGNKSNIPMLSVYCLTYNHAEFIEDALKGFLNQKTNFAYNVFIFDDASTDGTSDILLKYQKKYPHIFNVFVSKENTYNSPNRKILLNELYDEYLTGKYVAWCEGDDYWTDENKLQMQVDYMESHPECSMTAHASIWENFTNHTVYEYRPYKESRIITSEEVILKPNGNFSTASLVMKKDVFMRADGFPTCDVDDIPMQMNAIAKGQVYYFNKCMSLYRYCHSGSWSETVEKDTVKYLMHCYRMVIFFEKYNRYTKFKFSIYTKRLMIDYLEIVIRMNNQISSYEFDEYYNRALEIPYGLKYLEQQKDIFDIAKGRYKLNENNIKLLKQYKYLVIMGTGKYSEYIRKMLDNNGIIWAGYIISNNQEKQTQKNDKNIWKLNEYPYNFDDTLVLVGINQGFEEDIIKSLKEEHCKNYLVPLWFEL